MYFFRLLTEFTTQIIKRAPKHFFVIMELSEINSWIRFFWQVNLLNRIGHEFVRRYRTFYHSHRRVSFTIVNHIVIWIWDPCTARVFDPSELVPCSNGSESVNGSLNLYQKSMNGLKTGRWKSFQDSPSSATDSLVLFRALSNLMAYM